MVFFETMDEAVNAAEEAQKKLVTMDVSERETNSCY